MEANVYTLRRFFAQENKEPLEMPSWEELVWRVCGPREMLSLEEAKEIAAKELREHQEVIEDLRQHIQDLHTMSDERLQKLWGDLRDPETIEEWYQEDLKHAQIAEVYLKRREEVKNMLPLMPQKVRAAMEKALEKDEEDNPTSRLQSHLNPQRETFDAEKFRAAEIEKAESSVRFYMSSHAPRFNLEDFTKKFNALNAIVPFPKERKNDAT